MIDRGDCRGCDVSVFVVVYADDDVVVALAVVQLDLLGITAVIEPNREAADVVILGKFLREREGGWAVSQ